MKSIYNHRKIKNKKFKSTPDAEDAKIVAKMLEGSSMWQSVRLQFKRICLTFDSRAVEHDLEKTYAAYNQNGGFDAHWDWW